jgi:aryl-alcohol dehydrogenase-like predicted oxidoreductase
MPRPPRPLGPDGPRVFPVGLGAMPLSCVGRPAEDEAVRVLRAAFDAGVELVDTADVYCIDHRDMGHNERLIARALREHGSGRITVATKGGLLRPDGDWAEDGRPEHLRLACEASLAALAVERIDLYYLHAPDPRVPFADSVGALAELRAAGKIRAVGLSNVSVQELYEALAIVPIAAVQNLCSPLAPEPLVDGMVETCAAEGITFVAYSPVGGADRAELAAHPALRTVAARHGVSPQRVALAWLLDASPCVLPIPGASRVASILDSAAAAGLVLEAEDRTLLDAAFLHHSP